MAIKKYTFIRADKDAVSELNTRIERINKVDLRRMGIKHKKVNQIDMTRFLFKNKIFISDSELKNMVMKNGGRLC